MLDTVMEGIVIPSKNTVEDVASIMWLKFPDVVSLDVKKVDANQKGVAIETHVSAKKIVQLCEVFCNS